ncbi:Acyl transferase domain-containing protein [Nonomuraea solani]|uniref:Acyl transferase domain-containing protein n=1 Tax=Nonomuraea solani TaxID=1144553 RepID=A0A1H6EX96_9ACTN|nr:type I polyketide synthase [Nonomuraea solani]SEH02033.1 Acyl transferase domain-containing protein [Nonomuraea solani]
MREPLAIVGVGCRLPGGIEDLESLWEALVAGSDLVTEVPPDRFDPAWFVDRTTRRHGKSYTAHGAFLDDLSGFDAGYFGIAPKEADRLDPQQRLMLELAVEALDDAAIDPAGLAGSDTAVFVGVFNGDYGNLQCRDPASLNAYSVAGWTFGNTANRVSYCLDLRGPSLGLDTACSSALVALHEAAQAVRSGECGIALAGGVNVLLDPTSFVGLSQASMLSARGRCQAFSAGADGYVRGEGAGMVVLKTLADARADGDRIHAVLLDTGTNADGRTLGLTHPGVESQARLLQTIYADVDVDDLVYWEAHGTGTPVGDPVECEAVGRAVGSRRSPGNALPIGSIKSNMGHLESAAGMAGLMKALLVLRHGQIPPSLHAEVLNPAIDWEGLSLSPVREQRRTAQVEPALAGVSSFGFGGVNAHALLAAPPAPPDISGTAGPVARVVPLIVSGRTPAAATELALRVADRCETMRPERFYDLAYTLTRRRGLREHRVSVLAAGPAEAAGLLREAQPAAAAQDGRIAVAFGGAGTPWPGMADDLMAADPDFRDTIKHIGKLLSRHVTWSLEAEMAVPASRSRLATAEVGQPAIFAMQMGILQVLKKRGLVPDVVFGHSVGEIAAACASGALDLENAVLLCAERGRAQQPAMGQGGMAAVGLPPDQAAEAIEPYDLEIAAINSDRDVTVAGSGEALERLEAELAGKGVFFRRLAVDFAFHSRAMDPVQAGLTTALAGLTPMSPAIPMISTVTGRPVDGPLDAAYWWRNVRQPVLFGQAAAHLADAGFRIFLEVGPHPVLQTYLKRAGRQVTVLPTLRRGKPGAPAVRTAVAALLAAGAKADWTAFFPRPGRVLDLPAYPWQRERHWNGEAAWWAPRLEHPLLGARTQALDPTWSAPMDPARVPWVNDHRVAGAVVIPAVGFVEMALAAGAETLDGPVEVVDMEVLRPLTIPEKQAPHVQVSVSEGGRVRIASRTSAQEEWQVHARCRVRQAVSAAVPEAPDPAVDTAVELGADEYYALATRAGFDYGPAFRGVRSVRISGARSLGHYRFAEPAGAYQAHPALVDAALQTGLAILWQHGLWQHGLWQDGLWQHGLWQDGDEPAAYVPVSFERVRRWRQPPGTGLVHALLRPQTDPREAVVDFTITDTSGVVVMELTGCRVRRLPGEEAPARHVTVLRAAPRPGTAAGAGIAMSDLLAAVEPHRLGLRERLRARRDRHARFMTAYGRLAAHFTVQAMRDLAGERWSLDDLVSAGMRPKYLRLARTLCAQAGELCEPAGEGAWRAIGRPDPGPIFADALFEFPEYAAEVQLLGRCGRHLTEVLRGAKDAVEVVFPQGGLQAAEHFYDSGPVLRPTNLLARSVLGELVAAWPAGRPLRVLEVGAGTGGMTAALLPLLPPERTCYTFTDLSPAFLTSAAARFKAFDFVDYRVLDLEEDLPELEASFDVVIAANVVHATTDLEATLGRIAHLLDDHGFLLLGETLDAGPTTMIFGLLDGWWSATDTALRPGGPLIRAADWLRLLPRCRLAEPAELRAEDEPAGIDTALFLATREPRAEAAPPAPPAPVTAVTPVTAVAPVTLSAPVVAGGWVIVTESGRDQALAEAVAGELTRAGAQATVSTGPGSARHVVYLLDGDHAAADADPAHCAQRVVSAATTFGAIAAALAPDSALWLVTRPSGTFPAPERPDFPGDAALWGVARCVVNEMAGLTVRKISLERGARDAERLVAELLAQDEEDEVVLTAHGRFVPRLRPAPEPAASGAEPRVLRLRNQGSAYRLDWAPMAVPVPGPGQVTIEVRAAGVNYRNVLWALGRLPADAAGGPSHERVYGFDCAGVVTAVGAQVQDLAPGDRVFATAEHPLASHVVLERAALARIPDTMGYGEAATLPVAFLTVRLALADDAVRLAPDETVLVHGASGGVGLAAIQHAKLAGARVIATASTPGKRDLLRMLGVDHVLDSRSLRFAAEVRAITAGRGVDVVLNSLAGDGLARGVELLRPRGRFVELGKHDLFSDGRLALSLLRGNISFVTVDLKQIAERVPDVAYRQFEEIARLVAAGTYRALPYRSFPEERVTEAFDQMRHSRHIGKLIIEFEPSAPTAEPRILDPRGLDPGAVYLVTGGLGGFGAQAAHWLARQGAKRIALTSRRGLDGPEARQTVASLTALGVEVTAHRADVTDLEAMRAITGPEVKGVVHAAMVLQDAPLTELTPQLLLAALEPKLRGALVLDRLAPSAELFVLFSSVTATVGNVRQANYAAGNLFCEALVRARRARGANGLAVAWGAVGEVGYLARTSEAEAFVARWTSPMKPAKALPALGELLAQDLDVALVGSVDWDSARLLFPSLDGPRFSAVRSAGPAAPAADLRELVLAGDEAESLVTDAVTRLLAGVLQAEPADIAPQRPLDELGIDSLMRAELQGAIWRTLGCDIPIMAIGPGTSAGELARQVLTRMRAR